MNWANGVAALILTLLTTNAWSYGSLPQSQSGECQKGQMTRIVNTSSLDVTINDDGSPKEETIKVNPIAGLSAHVIEIQPLSSNSDIQKIEVFIPKNQSGEDIGALAEVTSSKDPDEQVALSCLQK